MSKSPYLVDDHRLADVIAAIQAMGTYKYYKLDFKACLIGLVAMDVKQMTGGRCS